MAIKAIHLDQMPSFNYDALLWGERQIRSVANMTRQDGRDFLKIGHDLKIRPQVKAFSLEDANKASLRSKRKHSYEKGYRSLILSKRMPSRWGNPKRS